MEEQRVRVFQLACREAISQACIVTVTCLSDVEHGEGVGLEGGLELLWADILQQDQDEIETTVRQGLNWRAMRSGMPPPRQ